MKRTIGAVAAIAVLVVLTLPVGAVDDGTVVSACGVTDATVGRSPVTITAETPFVPDDVDVPTEGEEIRVTGDQGPHTKSCWYYAVDDVFWLHVEVLDTP